MQERTFHLLTCAALVAVICGAPLAQRGTPFLGNAGPPGYAALLEAYVDSVGPGETSFDYEAFSKSADQEKLRQDLREAFLSVDPSVMGPKVKMAWAINAYNFLVIDYLVGEYIASEGRIQSVMDKGKEVFLKEQFKIAGEQYSFNTFESTFLFGSEDIDPRLHFALVCGARGCPPLQPTLYRAQYLEDDMIRAVRRALKGPRQARIEGARVHTSQLFSWYGDHFKTYPGGALGFLGDHGVILPQGAILVPDIEWDWALNKP